MSVHKPKSDAFAIWNAALAEVDAARLVRNAITIVDGRLKICDFEAHLNRVKTVLLVGAGKASAAMACGAHKQLTGSVSLYGRINVPDGSEIRCGSITVNGVRPAGINLPTSQCVEGTRKIIELVRDSDAGTLVVFLVSGGGSALFEDPHIPLQDLCELITNLSRAGASIEQLNTVRKHLSKVKGGAFGQMYAAECKSDFPLISLMISDVPTGRPDLIASGPTVRDPSNPQEALAVLTRLEDEIALPPAAVEYLESLTELAPDKSCDPGDRISNFVLADNSTAVEAAAGKARSLGYDVIIADQSDPAESAEQAAVRLLEILDTAENEKLCVISGGEPVVVVPTPGGEGGRNQHLILKMLCEILSDPDRDRGQFCLLSGGTDGEDGNCTCPGAFLDNSVVESVVQSGSQSDSAHRLATFDSHPFLKNAGALLSGSDVQTNVRDLRILTRIR